ncbi:MAG TPA: zinc-ribbon domain-containing protein [Dongiaceae bacterium]|nr:zinc-ribbon domain-containing protein [Dongiaceae bacterium]
MIVACPSCGARFNLDPAKLLPAGRNVRCAKCDHRWRQMPEGMAEPAPLEQAPEPPAPTPFRDAAAEPPDGPAADSFAAPQPEEPESHPPSPPETPAEMAQSLAAIAEQVAGARGEGYTVSEGAPQASNPIARMARRTGPGPITVPPRMRPMRPAKRGSHLGLILVAGLVIGLLVAAYVFRDVIARTVPGADVIYSLMNLSTGNPADDLEISNFVAKIKKDEKTGQNVIDLSATIFNLSEYPVNMPTLMVIPIDDLGGQMEPMRFRLRELVVEPGQNINFQKTFDNWPSTAPSAILSVADAP